MDIDSSPKTPKLSSAGTQVGLVERGSAPPPEIDHYSTPPPATHPRRLIWPLLVALLVTLTYLTVPRQPFLIDDALSEKCVLQYARQHHLQFGTDIVFTYGPLGFLTSRHFFPATMNWRSAVDFLLGFEVAAGVCLLGWRMAWLWRVLLVALFAFLLSNIDPRSDLLIYLGVLAWGLLCILTQGRLLAIYLVIFMVILAFAALVKANFLILAGFSIAALMIDLCLRQHYKGAALFLAGFITSSLVGWSVAGQQLQHIPEFLTRTFWIVPGYDQAVALSGFESLIQRGLLLVLAGFVVLLMRLSAGQLCCPAASSSSAADVGTGLARRLVLLLWLSLFLFITWKHGFVRGDIYHMGFCFGFVPILALTLETVPLAHPKLLAVARGFALLCCVISVASLESYFLSSIPGSLAQPFEATMENLSLVLRSAEYRNLMLPQFEAVRQATQLPKTGELIGSSSVDVFGQEQCYATLNNFNYVPRPVFQSYLAFNSRLGLLNEEFYLSKAAPEYVLFELSPIDHKFPPLEDSRVLLHLLHNYQPLITEGPFILLGRRSSAPAQLSLAREGTARPGALIRLPDGTNDLWMQIGVEPSWTGKLRRFLYKPDKLRLVLWSADAKRSLAKAAAPAPMLAAGFLVSPLLLRNEHVLQYYSGGDTVRPAACSVEFQAGTESLWQPTIHFRLYWVEPGQAFHSRPAPAPPQ